MNGRIIAFSGKGGSGKTTLTSMVLRELIRTGRKPILAVDADPNATLGMTLGVAGQDTIADLRDRMGEAAMNPTEIPKDRLMDQYLAELLTEEAGYDLLTMGRPEGPKCYCYVNGLLRRYLSLLRKNYAYVLVDCEAGMEYLSRLVVDDVETIVLVAEATPVGLTTAQRIVELTESLPIQVRRRVLAINKLDAQRAESQALAALESQMGGLDGIVRVPLDEDLRRRCDVGEAVDDAAGSAARAAIEELTQRCLGETPAQPTSVHKELRS